MIIDSASLATLGGGIALAGGLIGSAIGIAIAASAGAATLSQDRTQLRNVIILAALPMSRAFYGIIMLVIVLTVVVPELELATVSDGFAVLACTLIAALSFGASGAYQGSVCASGISFLPKTKGKILTNSIMLAVFVELIAVLGLVFTIMALSMLELM
jgi:V/A-type H+-transporting ATPase subunit K